MDLGNYELSKNTGYTPPDPSNSAFKGLMTTDYDQLKKDLQTPGDLQINKAYDKADYTIRDTMGGGGLYGSSIHSDAIGQNASNRADSLAMNSANVGSQVEQMKNQNNQWLGNMSLNESNYLNNWNQNQNNLNQALVHDILLATLGNDFSLQQLDKQGEWGLKGVNTQADADEDAAMWGGLGNIAGKVAGGLLDNWDKIF